MQPNIRMRMSHALVHVTVPVLHTERAHHVVTIRQLNRIIRNQRETALIRTTRSTILNAIRVLNEAVTTTSSVIPLNAVDTKISIRRAHHHRSAPMITTREIAERVTKDTTNPQRGTTLRRELLATLKQEPKVSATNTNKIRGR